MKNKYYVVSMDEDGEWRFNEFEGIEDVHSYYGIDEPAEDYVEGGHPAEKFRTWIDNENPGKVLIYGKILLPKKKEIVTKWEFEEE